MHRIVCMPFYHNANGFDGADIVWKKRCCWLLSNSLHETERKYSKQFVEILVVPMSNTTIQKMTFKIRTHSSRNGFFHLCYCLSKSWNMYFITISSRQLDCLIGSTICDLVFSSLHHLQYFFFIHFMCLSVFQWWESYRIRCLAPRAAHIVSCNFHFQEHHLFSPHENIK